MSRKILKLSDYAQKHSVTVRTVWNWFYKGLIKIEKQFKDLTVKTNFVIFVYIPHDIFVKMITYKCELVGIVVNKHETYLDNNVKQWYV